MGEGVKRPWPALSVSSSALALHTLSKDTKSGSPKASRVQGGTVQRVRSSAGSHGTMTF